MKNRGKSVKLFYPDGDSFSLAIGELSNWSGKAYKIPRKLIKDIINNRSELKNTGVYLLFGQRDNQPVVYVGEAENVYNRLCTHLNKKDFWSEAIVFISKDNGLNKAFIKFLESRIYEEIMLAGRYNLKNSTKPTKSSLTEYDEVSMEEFLDHIKFLTGSFGHNLFIPAISKSTPEEINEINEEDFYYLNNSRGAEGIGIYLEGHKMKVFSGSKCASLRPSAPDTIKSLIKTLKNSNVIENNEFIKDYEFSSPSAAAGVLIGGHASGNEQWKTKNNIRLGSIIKAHERYE